MSFRGSRKQARDTKHRMTVKQATLYQLLGVKSLFKESVKLRDGSVITLAQCAARLNIQLLKTSVLNQKLQERRINKYAAVQKIYRAARDEKEVRSLLDEIWAKPESARDVLSEAISKNSDVYSREEEHAELGNFQHSICNSHDTQNRE